MNAHDIYMSTLTAKHYAAKIVYGMSKNKQRTQYCLQFA